MVKKVTKKMAKPAAKKTVTKKTAAVKKAAKKVTQKIATKKTVKVLKKAAKPSSSTKKGGKPQTGPRRSANRQSSLTPAELQQFRVLLIVKLKEMLGDVNHIELESLKASRSDASGDLSSMPIHMADVGSDNYEQEFVLGLMDGERKIVNEILAAIKRIEEGTFGICEGTGEPIPKARLEGIPWTRYCVEYAEKIEKGLVAEESSPYAGGFHEAEVDEAVYGYEDDEDDEEEEQDEADEPFYVQFTDEDEDEAEDEVV